MLRGGKRPLSVGLRSSHCVLNAFRHQRKTHNLLGALADLREQVLNAFRHQRKTHSTSPDMPDDSPLVLNAFRHQRKTHLANLKREIQRLGSCSTPFGIRGKPTRGGCRLSASSGRAQRLSASEENPRERNAPCAASVQPVLNAFRHQRKTHRPEQHRWDRSRHVLNAFRHQRKTHPPSALCWKRAWLCSTPFGIRGKPTSVAGCLIGREGTCSTPFGIRGKPTRPVPRGFPNAGR